MTNCQSIIQKQPENQVLDILLPYMGVLVLRMDNNNRDD